MTELPKIFIKSRRDERLLQGHLWVFSNEIENIDLAAAPGSLVDVYSHIKKYMGRGFFNPKSLISVRLLTRQNEPIDADFFAKRIEAAQKARELLYPGETAYRLVFGESDFLPGLVIDRYGDCFVLQSYCLGMDLLFPLAVQAVKKVFGEVCIVKKNDSTLRQIEGLKEEIQVIQGPLPKPLHIAQRCGAETLTFELDPVHGQKSGFYFDQRENRERLAAYANGRSVLDCFASSGGFGIYAAKAGAKEVFCVESGIQAVEMLNRNIKLNGVNVSVIQEDVYEKLNRFRAEKRKFDIVVLDPPALAKSKKNYFGALRKYEKLNEQALAVINPNGILVSCSCSHHVSRNDFTDILKTAAAAARREIQVLEARGASRDHPMLPSMPETEYLKCFIVRVV